jgi:carbonic anhydrase
MENDRALSRRGLLGAAVGAAAGGAIAGGMITSGAMAATPSRPSTPNAALSTLMAGNRRYRSGKWHRVDYSPVGERRAAAQAPFAAILTCADSRLAPALVFDVERGNIFSAQVAGNSLDDATAGSLEYAVAVLNVPLIMVLGHSDCGAVKAAIDVTAGKTSYPPGQFGSIGAVVDAIVPAVQALPAGERSLDRCIVANARVQAQALRTRGPILPAAIGTGRLRVVAAVYDIGSGAVELV